MDRLKILVDTNVFIHSEDYRETPFTLSGLLRILHNYHSVYVHPSSLEDIKKDRDEQRRKIMLSKVRKYPLLESPPTPDQNFISKIGAPATPNDQIDADLLQAVCRECVDFLITEDKEMMKKVEKLGISDRVLTIESALFMFKKLHEKKKPRHVKFVNQKKVYELDLNDHFFDSLKKSYPEFSDWFKKISRRDRDCWVYEENGKIEALLILKEEEEEIELKEKVLPKRKRLKICTIKVGKRGYKLGELFLKVAFDYCVSNNIFEVYLTHFTVQQDPLVIMLERFGFEKEGEKLRKNWVNEEVYEDVYVKNLVPVIETNFSPAEVSRKYYPSFVDSKRVKKFVIPIKPEFHDRLFSEYPKREQTTILDFSRITKIVIPGNVIDKMYLCHSRITQIRPGSIIIFYRSVDQRQLTTLGVVEEILRSRAPQKIVEFAGERTIYSLEEIKEMSKKPILCIRFRTHFYIPNPIPVEELIDQKVIGGVPQSIASVPHEKYLWIKKRGGINERFTFD
jgi:rRNA-processing protein FCF1